MGLEWAWQIWALEWAWQILGVRVGVANLYEPQFWAVWLGVTVLGGLYALSGRGIFA